MTNLIKSNILSVKLPDNTTLPKYYNKNEIDIILSSLNIKNRKELKIHFAINIMWQTGIRVSELLSLNVKLFDIYNKILTVKTLKKVRKKIKGRKPIYEYTRTIPLKDGLINEFLIYTKEFKITDLLFKHTRQTIFNWVRYATKKANIYDSRAHPHTFRHSFAVHLLKNGVPITVVQKLLGHNYIDNTMIYLAIINQESQIYFDNIDF